MKKTLAYPSFLSWLGGRFRCSLSFEVPAHLDLACLDQWLDELGQGLPGARFDSRVVSAESAAGLGLASTFLERCLRMYGLLLPIGRLPVFETPTVFSLNTHSQREGGYLAEVDLHLLDHVAKHYCLTLLRYAFELSKWAGLNPPSPQARQELYKLIDQKVVKPLHQAVPAGKSTLPVLRAASELGIPYFHLGGGVYQLGWGSRARCLDRSSSELDSAIGARLSSDKINAARVLRVAGLPAPVHVLVHKANDALTAARGIGFPVVVKPSDQDRGEGVTVDIVDEAGLNAAFAVAQDLAANKQVIVERQVAGICHRLFIARGKLLYAVKRLPMSVQGDGRQSVAELVNAALACQQNQPPWARSEIRAIDDLAVAALKRAGFTPDSVPGSGVWAPLRSIESTQWGGIDEEVSDRIHPDNLAAAILAARLLGLSVAGVDIITTDISVPWHENGSIINEVNFAPLLGGGAISRRYIPGFLKDLIQGDGRIPVETFDASSGEAAALARRAALTGQGLRCWLTSADKTLDAQGRDIQLALMGLENRVKALLCRDDVDALVLLSGSGFDSLST
jgi:cyanophycin synthetase